MDNNIDEQALEALIQDPTGEENPLHELDDIAISQLLEGLPVEDRVSLWSTLETEQKLDVLENMHSDSRHSILEQLSNDELSSFLDCLDSSLLVELYEDLPVELQADAIAALDKRERKYFEDALTYSDEEVGRFADRNIAVLPINARKIDATRLFGRREFAGFSHCIYLIDRLGQYSGAVSFANLTLCDDNDRIAKFVNKAIPSLNASDNVDSVVEQIEQAELPALPVVERGRLIGQLSIQVLLDVRKEQLEQQMMSQVGLTEAEDLFAPVARSAKHRSTWLGINLLTAFLAAFTIKFFETTVEQVVALAVLMPIVASMGGIAGSQTLTLVIRAIALGQLSQLSIKPLSLKEFKVGFVNAIFWSIIISISTYLWFGSFLLALVIAVAIIINIVCAAYVAVWIPVILKKLNIDPALSGAVILTTVTDVVGFVAFLGLGTLVLI